MSDQPTTTTCHPVASLCARFGQRLDELVAPGALTLWSASDDEVAGVIAAAENVIRRAEAIQDAALAEASRRDLATTVGATSTTAWAADLLTARRAKVTQAVKLGEQLAGGGLAATGAAFAAGDIDADQARVIATAISTLPTELGADVIGRGEQLMLAWAGDHNAQVLSGYGAHLLTYLAPDVAEQAEAEALARAEARDANRTNSLSARVDHRGRIRLAGELDPESWATVSAALEPFAKPGAFGVTPGDATTPAPPGNATPTPWWRSAGAAWPPRTRRPASGSPPTSPSPSTTRR